MPNMNPKQMKKMMRQMGMKMDDLDAEQVIIKLADSKIIIDNPQVQAVTAMGQKTYQISGDEKVVEEGPSIPDDDIKLVMEQTSVSAEKAHKALEASGGDLAQAILELQKD